MKKNYNYFTSIILPVCFLMVVHQDAKAATPGNWTWAVGAHGGGDDNVAGLKIGSTGDLFIAGRFGAPITIPGLPALGNVSSWDPYIARVSNTGVGIWRVGLELSGN